MSKPNPWEERHESLVEEHDLISKRVTVIHSPPYWPQFQGKTGIVEGKTHGLITVKFDTGERAGFLLRELKTIFFVES